MGRSRQRWHISRPLFTNSQSPALSRLIRDANHVVPPSTCLVAAQPEDMSTGEMYGITDRLETSIKPAQIQLYSEDAKIKTTTFCCKVDVCLVWICIMAITYTLLFFVFVLLCVGLDLLGNFTALPPRGLPSFSTHPPLSTFWCPRTEMVSYTVHRDHLTFWRLWLRHAPKSLTGNALTLMRMP